MKVYYWPAKPDEPMPRAAIKCYAKEGLRYTDLLKAACWRCGEETKARADGQPPYLLYHQYCDRCSGDRCREAMERVERSFAAWEQFTLIPNMESRLRLYMGMLRQRGVTTECRQLLLEIIEDQSEDLRELKEKHGC